MFSSIEEIQQTGAWAPWGVRVKLSVSVKKVTELVSRIESGDRHAESELVERYARGIRLFLLQRTENNQAANDLCQDTFVVVLRRLRAGELNKHESLSGFVRQVALNLSINHFRKEQRYVLKSDIQLSERLFVKDQTSRDIDGKTVREAIDGALDQLAVPRDRAILRRFYLADEDKGQICEDFGLTSSHFDRVLYRARKRMLDLINNHPGLRQLLVGEVFDVH